MIELREVAYDDPMAVALVVALKAEIDDRYAYAIERLTPEERAADDAGYRAVAPFLRGYAPSAVPADGRYQTAAVGLDACALHEALGGAGDAAIIGHDWGAMGTYVTARHEPERWRRVVAMAVPPAGAVAGGFMTYAQLKRSWYMFFFQHPLADVVVGMGDLDFIDGLWADWSPGYDASEDLPHVKDALRDPANLQAALGYYRATLGGVGVDPELEPVQQAGNEVPPQPTLYLHGRTDGCMGIEVAEGARGLLTGAGSRMEVVDDAGHFLHLERPDLVNRLILDFLAE